MPTKTEPIRSSVAQPALQLPPLPYAQDALAPALSAKTMSFHYGKHHQAYVDNLNKLIAGTPLAGQPLDKIIREACGAADKAAIFNNAAQVWNHTFFWQSMKAGGGGQPAGDLLKKSRNLFRVSTNSKRHSPLRRSRSSAAGGSGSFKRGRR